MINLKYSFDILITILGILIKHIQLDFKIEAMLINRFNKRLFSDKNDSIDIAKSIQDKLLF